MFYNQDPLMIKENDYVPATAYTINEHLLLLKTETETFFKVSLRY